jgi:hypothetical protein
VVCLVWRLLGLREDELWGLGIGDGVLGVCNKIVSIFRKQRRVFFHVIHLLFVILLVDMHQFYDPTPSNANQRILHEQEHARSRVLGEWTFRYSQGES